MSKATAPDGPDADEPRTAPPAPGHPVDLGAVVETRPGERVLTPDGDFHLERRGAGMLHSRVAFHRLLTTSWPRFLIAFVAAYLLLNLAFAAAYHACGPTAIKGLDEAGAPSRFAGAFFLSVQTFATIGYGTLAPVGRAANWVSVIESVVETLFVALGTGIIFARFSRPQAHIRFARYAVAGAPDADGARRLAFRLANADDDELVEVEARLVLVRRETRGRAARRSFHELPLVRPSLAFFPVAWTVEHRIDAASPLHGCDAATLAGDETEFILLVRATDDATSQTVHARHSWLARDLRWDHAFEELVAQGEADGDLALDVSQLDRTRPA